MVDINKAVIARVKTDGETFEVLVDCDKAIDYRKGNGKLEDALVSDKVFKDAKQGERAPEHELEKAFGTTDTSKIADIIVKTGEIQLTASHRNKLREEKRKQVINLLHRNAIDSKTGLPHPPQRLERAMEEAKVKIDEFKEPEGQIQEILKKLQPIIPIKFETRELAVKVPAKYGAQSFRLLKNFGKMLKNEWQTDGSLVAVIEIPAGIQEEFFDELNKLTRGEVETKILNRR